MLQECIVCPGLCNCFISFWEGSEVPADFNKLWVRRCVLCFVFVTK